MRHGTPEAAQLQTYGLRPVPACLRLVVWPRNLIHANGGAVVGMDDLICPTARLTLRRRSIWAATPSHSGSGGSDTLSGGAGNGTLNGWASIDRLLGGDGDDIDIIETVGDLVVETNANSASGGIDRMQSSLATSSLTANVENLTLTGVAAINGTGNSLNNVSTGNAAVNIFDGGAGNDTLIGGAGADIFRFDSPLNATTKRDVITDVDIDQGDTIELENAVFTALTTTGPLAASASLIGVAATISAHRIFTTALQVCSPTTATAAALPRRWPSPHSLQGWRSPAPPSPSPERWQGPARQPVPSSY